MEESSSWVMERWVFIVERVKGVGCVPGKRGGVVGNEWGGRRVDVARDINAHGMRLWRVDSML